MDRHIQFSAIYKVTERMRNNHVQGTLRTLPCRHSRDRDSWRHFRQRGTVQPQSLSSSCHARVESGLRFRLCCYNRMELLPSANAGGASS